MKIPVDDLILLGLQSERQEAFSAHGPDSPGPEDAEEIPFDEGKL